MKKYFLLLLFLICLLVQLPGQTFQPKQLDEQGKGLVYEKEFSVDLKILQTNGFALGVNVGKLKTYYKTRFWHIEIGELKNPKEFRQNSSAFTSFPGSPRSYIYGKQNNFYLVRGGFGVKRYLSEKARQKGVAVGFSYEFGPTLGLLKPYYLELPPRSDNLSGFTVSEKYSEENADRFLDPNQISGASGFTRGLGEISPLPGAHAMFAFHFDWGAFDEVVKALEAGLVIDVFPREVPILVERDNVENTPIFFNVYVNLQFGKRW